MEELADKLIDKALDGDHQALKEVGDRLEGKTPQTISNDAGEAFVIKVRR